MNLSVGIVGFPNAGKSTLFNALLKRQIANTAPYPFCTIEPNKGVVPVPDERLPVLAKIVKTEKIVPAIVEFVDIAGLVKGAHKGEGLGNQFLAHIREASLVLFMLRGFDLADVDRAGSANPSDDLEALKTELILKDLDTLDKQKEPKGVASKQDKAIWEAILKARQLLNEGKYLFDFLQAEDKVWLRGLFLLTLKDYLVAINVLEKDLPSQDQLRNQYRQLNPLVISAKTEEELGIMTTEEQREYLATLGLAASGLERLIRLAYQKLQLISFLTAGEIEVRAWTIQRGTPAQLAAGVIHTDFINKFIKAKVANYQDFVSCGGWKEASDKGKVRFEGRDYQMQEGDVVEFMIGK
jgi:hypothetical protein